ncbi:YceI family protein [Lipingzhangella sp. LS1_29]|uniref:YceI family protein n=1 Tax=Lipingzhangella rawalii TaxID=2055835 RepID=A0ABU2H6N4_9ACTN|nr:YceI family protein [Lipingzhangella rawalii]MDS1270289.1 YceI family protein [Lipingzhangella rawalii]
MSDTPGLVELGPGPGTWHLDPMHSSLIFVARYLAFGRVQGTFGRARGQVQVPSDPLQARVDVTLDASSINTGVAARDHHLRSPDFLDVATHPELRFVSRRIARDGTRTGFRLTGDLTIHGVTNEIVLTGRWVGDAPDYLRYGQAHGHFFTANSSIRLSDFGVGDGGEVPWGGRLVGDVVDIVLEARLQNQDPTEVLRELGHE